MNWGAMTDCVTVNATMGCCPFCNSQCHTLAFPETLTRTIHQLRFAVSYQYFALAWSICGNLRACLVTQSTLTSRRATSRRTKLQQPTKVQFHCFLHSRTQPPSRSPAHSTRTQSSMPHLFRPFRGKPTIPEEQAEEMDSKSNQTNPSQSAEGATNMPTISNPGSPHHASVAYVSITTDPGTSDGQFPTAANNTNGEEEHEDVYDGVVEAELILQLQPIIQKLFPALQKEQRTRPEAKPRRSHVPRHGEVPSSLGV